MVCRSTLTSHQIITALQNSVCDGEHVTEGIQVPQHQEDGACTTPARRTCENLQKRNVSKKFRRNKQTESSISTQWYCTLSSLNESCLRDTLSLSDSLQAFTPWHQAPQELCGVWEGKTQHLLGYTCPALWHYTLQMAINLHLLSLPPDFRCLQKLLSGGEK